VNYWYCDQGECVCEQQFVTERCSQINPSDPWCRAVSYHEDPNFEVRFDAYARVVYCNNVRDRVTINWVELTMNVKSATEPLDCQGAQTVRPALEGGWQTYRVNTGTPFPLTVGAGWRGSITFWDNRAFKKSDGDARFWVKDLAGVRAMMSDGNSTCGDSPYVGVPGLCFDEFFGGLRILTEKLATGGDWWFQRRDPPALCGL
jgi:hypothetical protein